MRGLVALACVLAAALAAAPSPAAPTVAPPAVRLRVLRLVDTTRTIRLPDGRVVPRTLVTYVRYPANAHGRLPLVVFAHGFALTPRPYLRLLDAWARAGFVVAAPVFPLESKDAPGGPNEDDLLNQPQDMSFVITRLLASSDPLRRLIDARRIAVAGHSDGAETAFAVAYDSRFHDPRVRAAVILSGSALPGPGGLAFPAPAPPLLAVQGTADEINRPELTYELFAAAPRPKYLLRLPGAGHLPPYTVEQPQLGVVERTTIAFLDRYLRGGPARAIAAAATAPGVAVLTADP